MSNTRLQIEQECVRLMAQADPEVSMVPVPFVGTMSAVGTITAPLLDQGTLHANRFDARRIKIAEDATAVAFATPVTATGVQTATTTSFNVSSTSEIKAGDILEIGTTLEKILVRAVVSATNLTVTRGYQGTTATATAGAETVRYDPFGQSVGVDDAGFATGGVLTISPDFSRTGYGAGSFIMYPKGIQPEMLTDRINSVLRNTDSPYIWFPSLVTDSDFAANSTVNWTAVASGTASFATTASEILFGERYLSVLTTAVAGSGVRSASFEVHEDEDLLVSTHLKAAAGNVKVDLFNATASTTTKSVTNLNERVMVEVRYRQAVPTNATQMYLQWLAVDTGGPYSVSVSPPVVVQSDQRRAYVTPSWFTRESQVKDVLSFRQGFASDVSDSYISLSADARTHSGLNFYRSDRDANVLRVEFCNPSNDPIGLEVMRPFGELLYDTATTNCDLNFLANRVVANILRDRNDERWRNFATKAASRAQALSYGGKQVTIEDRRVAVW